MLRQGVQDIAIQSGARDYMYERLAILSDLHYSDMYEHLTGPLLTPLAMRLNFLALCMVRQEKGDVAAVAMYPTGDTMEFYFAKNHTDPADVTLAEVLMTCIRDTAKQKHPFSSFRRSVFAILWEYCKDKLMRRLNAVSRIILTELHSTLTNNAVGNATENVSEPQRLAKILSCVETLIAELKYFSESRTLDRFMKISENASIVSQSSIIADIAGENAGIGYSQLRIHLRKLGQYALGAQLLYVDIIDNNKNDLYRCISVKIVSTPNPVQYELTGEDFDVVARCHSEATQEPMPWWVTANVFAHQYPETRGYTKRRHRTFIRHCEV